MEKGIQKPTHQLDIRDVRLLERIFKCDHPVAVRSILALVALAGIDPRFGCGFDAMSFLPLMPWHFLYFFPLPQGHGSFLPTFRAILPVPRTARSDFSGCKRVVRSITRHQLSERRNRTASPLPPGFHFRASVLTTTPAALPCSTGSSSPSSTSGKSVPSAPARSKRSNSSATAFLNFRQARSSSTLHSG